MCRVLFLCLAFGVAGCKAEKKEAIADAAVEAAALDMSTEDASDSQDAAPTCNSGWSQSSDACQACVEQNCCITASACAEGGGAWECSAATICRANNCNVECDLPAATCGDIMPSPPSCTSAWRASCCEGLSACGASDECAAVVYICIDAMGLTPGTSAFRRCAEQYPNGKAIFDDVNDCVSNVSC